MPVPHPPLWMPTVSVAATPAYTAISAASAGSAETGAACSPRGSTLENDSLRTGDRRLPKKRSDAPATDPWGALAKEGHKVGESPRERDRGKERPPRDRRHPPPGVCASRELILSAT